MTVKQYDQFLVDFVKGDTVVDSQWLQAYFRETERMKKALVALNEKIETLKAFSNQKEVIRLDVTV